MRFDLLFLTISFLFTLLMKQFNHSVLLTFITTKVASVFCQSKFVHRHKTELDASLILS